MGKKDLVACIMGAVLIALCIIVITCIQSIPLQSFTVFSAICGFFELHKWRRSK